jgi:hypothetical protein
MKIEPTGGAAQTICATALVIGGSWNREGTIIFGDSETISQAPAKDGEAKRVTTLDASREETAHSTPFFLPDGRHFLYTTYSAQIRLTPCRSSIKAGTNEFHDGLFEYVATTSSIHLRPSTVRRFPRSVESVQYPTRRTSNRNKTFPSNTPRNRNPEIFREIYSPPRRAHVEHSISGIFHHESWKAQLDSPPPREPPPH